MVVETFSADEVVTRTSRVDRMIETPENNAYSEPQKIFASSEFKSRTGKEYQHHDHLKQQTPSIDISTSVAEAYN